MNQENKDISNGVEQDYYLRIGRATDLKNPKERFLFRLFEIFPGASILGSFIFSYFSFLEAALLGCCFYYNFCNLLVFQDDLFFFASLVGI